MRAVYNTPHEAFPLLCSWPAVESLRSSYTVKTKAYSYALLCIYVCPTSAHRDFRYRYRRYKYNIFTPEYVLFGLQNMILWFDLTLLNINISKKSTFVLFSANKFVLSMIIRIFTTSVLAKPLNNAQIVRGVFCLYTFEYGESYSLYKTVWIFGKSR